MASVDDVIVELRKLTPEQVDEVARVIEEFSHTPALAPESRYRVPDEIVEKAVRNGWPTTFFEEVVGSIPDLERPAQPPLQERPRL